MLENVHQAQSDYFLGRVKNYIAYKKYLRHILHNRKAKNKFDSNASNFCGYPENHNYSFYNQTLIPGSKLFERFEKISQLYPVHFKSLLDISACRGFYVLEAGRRDSVEVATGIDIDESFIRECNAIKMYVGDTKSDFSVATLEATHKQLTKTNTQYEVVIFTGSYHYFYWGSSQSTHAYLSHDAILKMMADITSDRIIFSGRMEISNLASFPKQVALNHPNKKLYNTKEFLRCANKYFKVSHHGFLGKCALYLLEKRHS